jgi:hypothetical protein
MLGHLRVPDGKQTYCYRSVVEKHISALSPCLHRTEGAGTWLTERDNEDGGRRINSSLKYSDTSANE